MARTEETIHVKLSDSSSPLSGRVKPLPKASFIPVPFSYTPSDDGTDENLLILLHGLGDTHSPFAKLGRQLKLPQTATLALRAPERIPFLYEEAYQWYPSFDGLGDLIDRPDPTPAMTILSAVIDHLVKGCDWPMNRIHLFGFGQGGSVAVQFAIEKWKDYLLQQQVESKKISSAGAPSSSTFGEISTTSANMDPSKDETKRAPKLGTLSASQECFASIVTVSGPLLSYPTLSKKCPTPVFVAYRPPPAEETLPLSALNDFKKAFSSTQEVKLASKGGGMPASREDWEPIMRFWSEKLERRRVEGLYEVMGGMTT